MSVQEQARHELIQRLVATLGEQAAATLMTYLPPVGWADVATKRDLDALEERLVLRTDALVQREIGGLRGEMHHEIGGLRGEMQQRFDQTQQRFDQTQQRFDQMRDELRRQTLLIVFSLVGALATLTGISIAAG